MQDFYKADEIIAEQIEKARAAGAEYQGREAAEKPAQPEKRKEPSAKADKAHAPESGSAASDVADAESRRK